MAVGWRGQESTLTVFRAKSVLHLTVTSSVILIEQSLNLSTSWRLHNSRSKKSPNEFLKLSGD